MMVMTAQLATDLYLSFEYDRALQITGALLGWSGDAVLLLIMLCSIFCFNNGAMHPPPARR